MEVSKDNGFRNAFFTLKSSLVIMDCRQNFSKPENVQFESYSRIVPRLFTFIELSRLRN